MRSDTSNGCLKTDIPSNCQSNVEKNPYSKKEIMKRDENTNDVHFKLIQQYENAKAAHGSVRNKKHE